MDLQHAQPIRPRTLLLAGSRPPAAVAITTELVHLGIRCQQFRQAASLRQPDRPLLFETGSQRRLVASPKAAAGNIVAAVLVGRRPPDLAQLSRKTLSLLFWPFRNFVFLKTRFQQTSQ